MYVGLALAFGVFPSATVSGPYICAFIFYFTTCIDAFFGIRSSHGLRGFAVV